MDEESVVSAAVLPTEALVGRNACDFDMRNSAVRWLVNSVSSDISRNCAIKFMAVSEKDGAGLV